MCRFIYAVDYETGAVNVLPTEDMGVLPEDTVGGFKREIVRALEYNVLSQTLYKYDAATDTATGCSNCGDRTPLPDDEKIKLHCNWDAGACKITLFLQPFFLY